MIHDNICDILVKTTLWIIKFLIKIKNQITRKSILTLSMTLHQKDDNFKFFLVKLSIKLPRFSD